MRSISIQTMDRDLKLAVFLSLFCPIWAVLWVVVYGGIAVWLYALIGSGIPAIFGALVVSCKARGLNSQSNHGSKPAVFGLERDTVIKFLMGWAGVAWLWGSLNDQLVWRLTQPLVSQMDDTYYTLIGLKYALSSWVEPYAVWKRFFYSTISLMVIFWGINLVVLQAVWNGSYWGQSPSFQPGEGAVKSDKKKPAAIWQIPLLAGFGVLLPYLIYEHHWFWPVIDVGTRDGQITIDQDPYYSVAWILGGVLFIISLLIIHSTITKVCQALYPPLDRVENGQ